KNHEYPEDGRGKPHGTNRPARGTGSARSRPRAAQPNSGEGMAHQEIVQAVVVVAHIVRDGLRVVAVDVVDLAGGYREDGLVAGAAVDLALRVGAFARRHALAVNDDLLVVELLDGVEQRLRIMIVRIEGVG